MLQQTRADQALPYYERFLKKFPTLQSLALAKRQDVLKMWEGLGYYSRAVRAHETALFLVEHHRGKFPETLEGLLDLPGVGPYTAAAVGSLAFGLDAAVVDGNVARVLSRVFAYDTDVQSLEGKRQIQEWAQELLPRGKAGMFNEAMMELGATLCSPRKPSCLFCPVRDVCVAAADGSSESYPVKQARKAVPHKMVGAALVMNKKKQILIAQRREDAMLGGLWEFPGGKQEEGETIQDCIARELKEEMGIDIRVGDHFITVKHAFSHFTMDLHAYWAQLIKGRPKKIHCADWKWVTLKELRAYPFPRADVRIIEALEKTGLTKVK